MRLQEVTIRGFKSFAHTTSFAIDTGLTAIIGPNGSGKSNFTEAIRWVLGEQSLKNLRGRKSDDVIFAGSAQHKRAGAATVTLTFSNDEGRFAVASPEVAITRRLSRAGESEYLLNKDPVRLLDVQQLLAEAGIGTKSYTVISQGMVDRYLTATPAARRELFDEACGIKPLQLKVARAQRQLSQARTEAQALRVVVQELAPRLRLLQRQAKRHEERLSVEHAFKEAQAQWLHHRWHVCQTALAQAAATEERARQTLTAARHERDAVEQSLLTWANRPPTDATATRAHVQQRLTEAEAAYRQQHELYVAHEQEQQTLIASLRTIRTQHRRAEAALAQARAAATEQSIWQHISQLLRRCDALLENFLQGHAPSPTEVGDVRSELATALQDATSDTGLIHTAHALLERLEGPLQAVARLQALEQDRASRLAQWPERVEPSTAAMDAARAALEQQDHAEGTPATNRATPQAQLQAAREKELAAERAASKAESAKEHAAQAVEELRQYIARERGSQFLETITQTPPPTPAPRQEDVAGLAARVAALGEVDPLAVREYEETKERYNKVAEQLHDIESTEAKIQRLITTVSREMQVKFRQQFTTISRAFTHYFQRLFGAGEARLLIVEGPPDTAVEEATHENARQEQVEGVEIFVHPPGKKLQHVQLLSGGEKALTSLALLLAILEAQRPPFLVLDEVDAALDEANSHRFAALLKEKSATTQCLVISHNRETMAQADVLYGITMQPDGVSRVYSVKLQELLGDAAPEEMRV